MKLKFYPRKKEGEIENRRKNVEKDLPAEQHLKKENSRLQTEDEDKKRAADPEAKTHQRKNSPERLSRKNQVLTFPRSIRVRSRADYLRVQRSGQKNRGRFLIILSMDNGLPDTRFGITVTRKTGNAVTRNRIKRRIRELQRLSRKSILDGKDIVVIATREASRATFDNLRTEYDSLMRKAGLIP